MATADELRSDPRSTAELIATALTDEDEDVYWNAVSVLHSRDTPEVLKAAKELCESADPDRRQLGANILGQLGPGVHPFREEIVPILTRLLEQDDDADVLQAAAVAIGHLHDPRGIPALTGHKAHPDADVRQGVVFGLLTQEDEEAIRALIDLSEDEDGDVRNWATFGLGQMIELDTPEIREALWRRIDDPVDDARGEALLGLAKRHDPRTLEPLLRELETLRSEGYKPGLLLTEAAEELADPRLCPVLLTFREPDDDNGGLANAIAACCGEKSEADGT